MKTEYTPFQLPSLFIRFIGLCPFEYRTHNEYSLKRGISGREVNYEDD